jgi:kinesin family protein 11
VRVKPKFNAGQSNVSIDQNMLTISNNSVAKTYTFDKIFPPEAKQSDIFSILPKYIDQMLLGYNCTIFAYGQTGSGKTFTMNNVPDTNVQSFLLNIDRYQNEYNLGIIPRVLLTLFKVMDSEDTEYSIRLSMVFPPFLLISG